MSAISEFITSRGKMRTIEELKSDVLAAIDNRRDEIISIGHCIWENPEPGYKEYKTAALVEKKLQGLGLEPKTGYSITGLRADLKCNEGPTVAVLGEMDSLILPTHPESLPETGAVHACGHHTMTTAMLGTAMGLVDAKAQEELAGNVAFVACPAEECIELEYRSRLIAEGKIKALGGKASLIFDGVFDDVDAAIMQHCTTGGYHAADHNGFCMKSVIFHGESTHAAAPQNSQNALSAANLALHALALLREKFSTDSSTRMHGILTSGGDTVNIIPDTAKLEYQLRAFDMNKVKLLSEAFDKAVEGCASALGCTCTINSIAGYYPLINNDKMGELYTEAVHRLHPDAAVNTAHSLTCGSTDIGDLCAIMPVFQGSCPGAQGSAHSVTFKVVDDEKAFIENTKINALMVIDLLYGNAEIGKALAEEKKKLMSIEQYKEFMNSFNYVR